MALDCCGNMDNQAGPQFRHVIVTETPLSVSVIFNRPKVLNSMNFPMIAEVKSIFVSSDPKRLIMRGAGKAFCSGADIITLNLHPEQREKFFHLGSTFSYTVKRRLGWSVAFLKGITMGGGAGFSYYCKVRFSMPSTVWAFPETSIGTVPDTSANFIFNHVTSKAVGRYLALTGDRLNGADCFFLGISTHYLPDGALEDQAAAELAECADVEVVLAKYHRDPERSACRVLADQAEIEETFGNPTSLEDIIGRLKRKKTPWARKTLGLLHYMCPLSLKVEFMYFELASSMTHTQVCMKDFDVIHQLTSVHDVNFREAVQHRLIRKEKTRPAWSPSSVEEVDPKVVSAILSKTEGPRLALL